MKTGDTLYDALLYALEQAGDPIAPVAVLNATGNEDPGFVKISGNACYKLQNTLEGVFSTILIRATRQLAETLGLLAQALDHIALDGRIYIAQENAHGAGGLEKHILRASPNAHSVSKFKCRIITIDPADVKGDMRARWASDAAIKKVKHNRGEFWSAPGVFSWDRPDAGSLLLLAHLPDALPGRVADLGCGNGLLSINIIKKTNVSELYAIDADDKAVECCKRNLADRGTFVPSHVVWGDATADTGDWPQMDYVVMNPPFHTQQEEDRELGQRFCNSAMKLLRSGGELYLVANRHMPYEAVLQNAASKVAVLADTDGFKVIRAIK